MHCADSSNTGHDAGERRLQNEKKSQLLSKTITWDENFRDTTQIRHLLPLSKIREIFLIDFRYLCPVTGTPEAAYQLLSSAV